MEADGAEDSLEDSIKPPQKPRRKYKIMANFNMVSTEKTPQSKLLALNSQGTTTVCNQPLGIKEDEQFQAKELLLKTENQIKDIPTTPIFTSISAPSKLQHTEQHGGTDLNTCLYSASVDNFVPSPVQDFNFSRKSGIMNIPENVFVETERTHKNVSVQTNFEDETYFYEADDLKNCRGDVNYSLNKLLGSDFKIVADMKEAEEHSEDTITEIDLRVEKAQKQDIDLPKIKDYFDNKMKKSKLEDSKPDHVIINMEGLCQHRSPDIFEDSEENQFIETKNDQSRNFSSGALNPEDHKTTSSRATTDTQRNEDTSPEEVTSSHEITNTLNMIEKNTDYIGNNEKMEICSDSSIPSSIPSTILNSKSTATKEVQYSASDVSAAATTETSSKRWENEINDTTEFFTDTGMPSPVLSKRKGSIEEKEFCSHRFTKKDTRYSENETFSKVEGYIEEKATVNNSRKDGSFVSHNAAYNREFSKYGESDSHEKYSMSYSRTAHSSNNEGQSSGYRHESRGYRNYGEIDYFQKPHLPRKYLPTLMDNPSELIPVRSSVCHQVLFKEANDVFNTQEGSMIQRHAFILPCDPNLKTSTGETRWDIIKETLVRKFWSLKDLSSALTVLNSLNKRNFKSEKLETFFIRSYKKETFFSDDLPLIAKLALRLPELFRDNPWLLKKGYNLSISMTQEQAACLVAHMFFCSYPDRVLKSYPDRIDFQSLYSRLNERVMREKLRCLINYLSYVARYFHGERRQFDNAPLGVVTITRQAVEEPNWIGMEKEIGITLDVVTDGAIEDDEGLLHVDFANRAMHICALCSIEQCTWNFYPQD